MRAEHHVAYSLDMLCAILAFAPPRPPLAFAAAQPRCRLAVEAAAVMPMHSCGPLRRYDVGAAWTTWAAQLPFGEWWVSELAQRVAPSEVSSLAAISVEEEESAARIRNEAARLPQRPVPLPLPSLPSLSTSSALRAREKEGMNYRTYAQRRTTTTARCQVRGPGEECATWPDCPYPGEGLRCVLVRGGYAGGFHVGHLTSFLLRSDDSAGEGEREGTCFRRILHWDVGAEEMHALRHAPPQRTAASKTPPSCLQGIADAANADAHAAHRCNSWCYAYWWLCRPLCWSCVKPFSAVTEPPLSGSSSSESPALTSLYVYGSHPTSVARHLAVDVRTASGLSTNVAASSLSLSSAARPAPVLSASGGAPYGGGAAFLTALHFHDCRVPRAATRRLEDWYDVLQRAVGCCAALTTVQVDLDGCLEVPAEEDGVDAPPSDASDDIALPKAADFVSDGPCRRNAAGSGVVPSACTVPAASAVAHFLTPPMTSLTEVRVTDSALCDIGLLGHLPLLRLADVSNNAYLVDAGVYGVSHSTSLQVVDLSHCVLVDEAAAAVATIVSLEELYLSGTAVSDATLRVIVAQQRHRDDRTRCVESAVASQTRGLRVLHTEGCRRIRSPLSAFRVGNSAFEHAVQDCNGQHGEPTLEDFCASAASRPRTHEAPREAWPRSGDESGEAEERRETNTRFTADNTVGFIEGVHNLADPSTPRPAAGAETGAVVGRCPSVASLAALTTLELHHTVLRHLPTDGSSLKSLQRLSLQHCTAMGASSTPSPTRPSWTACLQSSTALHTVDLEGCDDTLTDAASLQALAQLPSLQNLSLHHTRVRDGDVAALVHALHRCGGSQLFSPLQQLSLGLCSRLSRVPAVATLLSLRVLDLSDTAVQQDLVEMLGACATHHTLQVLCLAACAFLTDVGPLAALPSLRRLDLSHTPLTTAAVAGLRQCPALTHLSLKSCAALTHVRDVLAIRTLEVLNVQGAGLQEAAVRATPPSVSAEREELGREEAEIGGRGRTSPLQAGSQPGDATAPYSDVFPVEDDVLCRSRLHTLLLSHTRVSRIRRLGLLPALMCLDAGATGVTDAELAMFVCTGLQRNASPRRRAASAVAHSLEDLCDAEAAMTVHRSCRGPPLRVLSLQLCRRVFAVGALGLCPHLTKLDLSFGNVTSRGLVGLHRSCSLQQLRLAGCKGVHDLRPLSAIASLHEVEGSGCNVHSGRLPGDAEDGGLSAAPPDRILVTHSDVFGHTDLPEVKRAALLRFMEGGDGEGCNALRTASMLSCTVAAPQLHRITLDGCVNIRGGLSALGCLPAVVALSFCNCSGLTDASLDELDASARGGAPLFPALRYLYLSRCRNLTGTLKGLEFLPLLQRVHVMQSGITSVTAVEESLRSRVILEA